MVEIPRLCYDDANQTERCSRESPDSMTALALEHDLRSDMVVA